MLSCIVGNKGVNTFQHSKEKLRKWSDKKILKCPECGERVIYCHGEFKVPYFKHEAKSDCSGAYSESYTDEHIDGIKLLYNWLSTLDNVINLEVEKYIKNTKQRPDIYFEIDGDRYCIEFQCSPISTKYKERGELYSLEGIKDIWILGMDKYDSVVMKSEDFISKNSLAIKEYKTKTIEREINDGKTPLIYLDVDNEKLYKIDKDGYKCVHRDGQRWYHPDCILKTMFNVGFTDCELSACNEQFILTKDNETKLQIFDNINKKMETINKVVDELDKMCKFIDYKATYVNSDTRDIEVKIIRNGHNDYKNLLRNEFNRSRFFSLDFAISHLTEIFRSESEYIETEIKETNKLNELINKIKSLTGKEAWDVIRDINTKLSLIDKRYNVQIKSNSESVEVLFSFKDTELFRLNITEVGILEFEGFLNKNIDEYFKNIKRVDNKKISKVLSEIRKNLKCVKELKYSSNSKPILSKLSLITEEEVEFTFDFGNTHMFIVVSNDDVWILEDGVDDYSVKYENFLELKSYILRLITNKIRKERYPRYDL